AGPVTARWPPRPASTCRSTRYAHALNVSADMDHPSRGTRRRYLPAQRVTRASGVSEPHVSAVQGLAVLIARAAGPRRQDAGIRGRGAGSAGFAGGDAAVSEPRVSVVQGPALLASREAMPRCQNRTYPWSRGWLC